MRTWYFVSPSSLKDLENGYTSCVVSNGRHKNVKPYDKGLVISKVKNGKEIKYFGYSIIVMSPNSNKTYDECYPDSKVKGVYIHDVESTSDIIDLTDFVKTNEIRFSQCGVVGEDKRELVYSHLQEV